MSNKTEYQDKRELVTNCDNRPLSGMLQSSLKLMHTSSSDRSEGNEWHSISIDDGVSSLMTAAL